MRPGWYEGSKPDSIPRIIVEDGRHQVKRTARSGAKFGISNAHERVGDEVLRGGFVRDDLILAYPSWQEAVTTLHVSISGYPSDSLHCV